MRNNAKADPFRKLLTQYMGILTRKEFKTLKGLIDNGNEDGAMKGLAKILRRKLT